MLLEYSEKENIMTELMIKSLEGSVLTEDEPIS